MEMQLMIPSPAISTNTTPYATAPSTPHHFPNFFYSTPTTPIHVGFQNHEDDGNDFAFDFSGQLEPPSISDADELFHCGKIKTLNPLSDDQPISPTSRFTEAISPRCKKKNIDYFTVTFDQTPGDQTQTTQSSPKRERETTTGRTRAKVSRSSSPFRISDILSGEDNNEKNYVSWYNKWNLKNLLLFRSASDGSARRRKDPVNKYSRIRKDDDDDVKNSSFRSTDSCSSDVVGLSRRRVSAHEIHYTENRAVAEEMRRKTFLPYKSGLLGCLGFDKNGGSVHEISRRITSVMKQRGV